jgi:hypothetical protein
LAYISLALSIKCNWSKGKETSAETLAKAYDFVQQIAKTPIVVNDSRGFFTSRVFGTFIQEGMRLLAEGVYIQRKSKWQHSKQVCLLAHLRFRMKCL